MRQLLREFVEWTQQNPPGSKGDSELMQIAHEASRMQHEDLLTTHEGLYDFCKSKNLTDAQFLMVFTFTIVAGILNVQRQKGQEDD